MSKFFVGQRVRLVRSIDLVSPAKNYGLEGRVIDFEEFPKGTLMRDMRPLKLDCDVSVLWDGECYPCSQNTLQLEPILPEGSAPSEFTFQQLMDNLQEVMA
ncbi:TPA: hypothetical protein QEK98_002969 [Stenotrophomonas maltophilia]|nr:hypothetical protein [Stenotrophomonas maltophilia]